MPADSGHYQNNFKIINNNNNNNKHNNDNLAVDIPLAGWSCLLFPAQIGILNVAFVERGKLRTREKPLKQGRLRTNNKIKLHAMTQDQEYNLGHSDGRWAPLPLYHPASERKMKWDSSRSLGFQPPPKVVGWCVVLIITSFHFSPY